MPEWTKPRICHACGKQFTLKDHGHPGARAAADALERGVGYDSRADYIAVAKCPECATNTLGAIMADAIMLPIKHPIKSVLVDEGFLTTGLLVMSVIVFVLLALAIAGIAYLFMDNVSFLNFAVGGAITGLLFWVFRVLTMIRGNYRQRSGVDPKNWE